MKPRRASAVVVAAALVAAAAAWAFRARNGAERLITTPLDRGDVVEVVGASGVLQAVTTVQVGSQVSGIIKELHADFNASVRRGQVIARLDPSSFEARVAQARANLVAARAQLERSRWVIADLKQKYERARELAANDLLPASDLDSARSAYEGAVAQNQADEAAVSQAAAALNQAEVDLGHTVIRAPIDGAVLARNVDVGQTVAASLQAPTLFVIANDMTRMQVSASVDEADIGRVRPGQPVSFRVDAYPEQTFSGRIEQVRLQPVVNQSVVTYNTIISVENRDLRLMPGMTATVSVLIAKRENALRLPTAALRFRPPGFEPARAGASPAAGTGTGRRPGAAGGAGAGRQRPDREATAAGGAEGRAAVVFVPGRDARPEPRRVRLGLSDGRFVEVLEGLADGERVVTGTEETGRSAVASPSPGVNNPFSPQRQERVR